MYMMSILLLCRAAMAVPQVTSTGSNFTPSALAIALPSETPTPDDHSPVFGSLEYHGGAWVTPTRRLPRCLICASVSASARARRGAARVRPATAAARPRSEEPTSELQSLMRI